MIEVRNLTKRYRELLVIDNFSHSFEESYYVCNVKSYHRAQDVRWRRFRYDDGDEPLRYAPRTLIVVITMKGATPKNERNRRKKLVR